MASPSDPPLSPSQTSMLQAVGRVQSTVTAGGMAGVALAGRLIYLMLFRAGLVTLMLLALLGAGLADIRSINPLSSLVQNTLLTAIIGAYGLTLVYVALIKRVRRLDLFALCQIILDLVGVTVLVFYTGAPESTFGFAYLLVIVGACTVLPTRWALLAAVLAVLSYLGVSGLAYLGVGRDADPLAPLARMTLSHFIRIAGLNVVAMVATAALSLRLAAELLRAAERIDSQRSSFHDLATLHREVIQSLQSGLITVDLAGQVATLNDAAGQLLGLRPEEAPGRRVTELLPGVEDYLASADLGAIVARVELTVRTRALGPEDADERILGVTVSRLMDHRGELVGRLINFQDLTDLRRAEEAARQADRLAVIGRMAATVAHEIRNPLAAICGSIELLSQLLPEAAAGEAQDLMQIVMREGSRLNGMIGDLLAYANPRPLLRARVDLAQEVAEIVQLFMNDRMADGAAVAVEQAAATPVNADVNRLRQVVWNLLRNALEANPRGPVQVTVRRSPVDEAELLVRDHGPGLPEEVRQHLFEPFFTTKENGTGLGLATVHRIIEDHSGRIELRNAEPGPGAEALITLPLSRESGE